ncbi:hypothetical protein ACOR62_07445 [Neisseria lisongii]|uniref:Uncharacterized protein n=1 Tax=Neisseria lisongii TaxID=2912188 RepID=A0AAW5AQK5_9NEIS|nr:hypothetical protein [Neisseria lisongii]MCF7530208.1 hypothetical protein [Neisseria lisongii]
MMDHQQNSKTQSESLTVLGMTILILLTLYIVMRINQLTAFWWQFHLSLIGNLLLSIMFEWFYSKYRQPGEQSSQYIFWHSIKFIGSLLIISCILDHAGSLEIYNQTKPLSLMFCGLGGWLGSHIFELYLKKLFFKNNGITHHTENQTKGNHNE